MRSGSLRRSGLGFAVVVLLAVTAAVWARPVQILSVKEQYREADLVVIATAIETRVLESQDVAAAEAWITVETDFSVEAIVEGNPSRSVENENVIVTLQHHQYFDKTSEISVVDGPSFIEFDPQLKHRYLMFLKRQAEGIYVPVNGQMDPGLSFFRLEPYERNKERAPAKQ